jgi:hypothetical protein
MELTLLFWVWELTPLFWVGTTPRLGMEPTPLFWVLGLELTVLFWVGNAAAFSARACP